MSKHNMFKDFFEKYREVILWLIGGGINSAMTYILYLILIKFLSYRFAFSITYVLGIVFAYFYNKLFVFKHAFSLKKFFTFPIVYLVHYLLSIVLLEVFVEHFTISTVIAPILILIIVTPVSFILSKLILKSPSDETNPGDKEP